MDNASALLDNTTLSTDSECSVSSQDQGPPRLVLVGDKMVGTTSLMRRFNLGLYSPNYRPEVSKVMRHTKCMTLLRAHRQVTIQFWDVEGGDRKTALLSVQTSHGVAVVYDVTNRTSFEYAQMLLDNINPRLSSLLIGNKLDLEDQRKVSVMEGRLLARIHKVAFLETSAKLQHNVDQAFQKLVSSVPDEYLRLKDKARDVETLRKWKSANSVCSRCSHKYSNSGESFSNGHNGDNSRFRFNSR